jgi:hypothetical protein
MGIMNSVIKFTGPLDDVIAYNVRGKIRMRRRPKKVRQTGATEHAARDFGAASHAAAVIRKGVNAEVQLYRDHTFLNRLNKAMVGVVKSDLVRSAGRRQVTTGNLHALERFRINQHCGVSCHYTAQRQYDGNLQVTLTNLPAQFNDKVRYMQFRAFALFPDIERGQCAAATSEIVTLSFDQARDITAFCLTIPVTHTGAAIVVLEAIAYVEESGKLRHMGYRNYNAADIVAIVPAAKKQTGKPSQPPASNESLPPSAPGNTVKGADPG